MSERDVLQTMETLMSSMSSGDWGNIMPDQFYSLIDNLQEIEGLDQTDIDQLEESYTQYLKLQGTFDDLDDNVEHKPDLLQLSGVETSFSSASSPHHSPYRSPLLQHRSLGYIHSLSPVGSGDRSHDSSGLNTKSPEDILQPNAYNEIKVTVSSRCINVPDVVLGSRAVLGAIPSPNENVPRTTSNLNTLGSHPNSCYIPRQNIVRPTAKLLNSNDGLNQQSMFATGGPVIEDEEEEFDWSTIM